MKVIETPPGKFTDEAFHVWETELGEKIASHVTLFRDKTIKGLFEKIKIKYQCSEILKIEYFKLISCE